MYKASRALTSIRPEELDQYLSRGWFRKDQRMFTSQFLQDGHHFRDLIALRHKLASFSFPTWFWKMRKNEKFSVFIDDAHPSATHEFLFQRYHEAKNLKWTNSLEEILFGAGSQNAFHTKVINIWHEEELVAAGFFDMGGNSAAGIVNFYDPRYAKYSLGNYLFYLAVEYALGEGLEYFYPGSFAPGDPLLENKLKYSPASLEYFHSVYRAWYPIRIFRTDHRALPLMESKLNELYLTLEDLGVMAYFLRNGRYRELSNSKWDSPYAVYIPSSDPDGAHFAVTFDVNTRRYFVFDVTERKWLDHIRVAGSKLICQANLGQSKPIADEYHFDAIMRKLNELIEY